MFSINDKSSRAVGFGITVSSVHLPIAPFSVYHTNLLSLCISRGTESAQANCSAI